MSDRSVDGIFHADPANHAKSPSKDARIGAITLYGALLTVSVPGKGFFEDLYADSVKPRHHPSGRLKKRSG